MASHERQEEWLDFGSGRYKLIGRPGREDLYLHVGEWVEVWNGTLWVAVQVLADEWGHWYLLDGDSERVSIELGMSARLVEECLVKKDIDSEEGSGVEVVGVLGSEASSLAFSILFRLLD